MFSKVEILKLKSWQLSLNTPHKKVSKRRAIEVNKRRIFQFFKYLSVEVRPVVCEVERFFERSWSMKFGKEVIT
jgi:hypothetical protein